MTVTLAACGGKEESAEETEPAATVETTTPAPSLSEGESSTAEDNGDQDDTGGDADKSPDRGEPAEPSGDDPGQEAESLEREHDRAGIPEDERDSPEPPREQLRELERRERAQEAQESAAGDEDREDQSDREEERG